MKKTVQIRRNLFRLIGIPWYSSFKLTLGGSKWLTRSGPECQCFFFREDLGGAWATISGSTGDRPLSPVQRDPCRQFRDPCRHFRDPCRHFRDPVATSGTLVATSETPVTTSGTLSQFQGPLSPLQRPLALSPLQRPLSPLQGTSEGL